MYFQELNFKMKFALFYSLNYDCVYVVKVDRGQKYFDIY